MEKNNFNIKRSDKIAAGLIKEYEDYQRCYKQRTRTDEAAQTQKIRDFTSKIDIVYDVKSREPSRPSTSRQERSDSNRNIETSTETSSESRLRPRESLNPVLPSTSGTSEQLKGKFVFFDCIIKSHFTVYCNKL